jgi:hypothetical protein
MGLRGRGELCNEAPTVLHRCVMAAKYTTKRDIAMAIALETGADARTVARWIEGKPVIAVAEWAFEQCAGGMGLLGEVRRLRSESAQRGGKK